MTSGPTWELDQVRQEPGLAAAMRELAGLYARLEEELRQLPSATGQSLYCLQGGCCCKFDLLDHRLYVSTLELAFLLARGLPAPAKPLRCPFARQGACLAHQRRPLGCRTFFCRREGQGCHELHERFHQAIRLLHQTHCLPYVYAELTAFIASTCPKMI